MKTTGLKPLCSGPNLALSLVLILLCLSCKKPAQTSEPVQQTGPSRKKETPQPKKEVIDEDLISDEIRSALYSPDSSSVIDYHPALIQFYDSAQPRPLFNPNSKKLWFLFLDSAWTDGLKRSFYLNEQQKNKIQLETNSEKEIAETDILLANAIIRYGQDLVQGRTDPKSLDQEWNYTVQVFDSVEIDILKNAIDQAKPQIFFEACRPDHQYYKAMRGERIWLNDPKNQEHVSMEFQYPGSSLHPGDSGDLILEMKYRLRNFGAYTDDPPSNIFDDTLRSAIKAYQEYHGLEADGIPGKATFEALNMSLLEMQNQVDVNLERSRWLIHDLPEDFVLVNIASYHLYIFRNRKPDFFTNVIVGKEHHETPIFRSTIKYIEFNCTWTVPTSITRKELLPKIQNDVNYLEAKHFDLLLNGELIDPQTVDFSEFNEDHFPYTLRQQPGPFNALGTMKFIFPNKYSVYLHDTPARYLFNKEGGRAFSHGCVRVQNPNLFAEELLRENNIDQEKIQEILETKETRDISLKKKMPVLLTYWTCYQDPENGHIYYLPDIYGRDSKILQALNDSEPKD